MKAKRAGDSIGFILNGMAEDGSQLLRVLYHQFELQTLSIATTAGAIITLTANVCSYVQLPTSKFLKHKESPRIKQRIPRSYLTTEIQINP